ncbi:MAG: hypothetical protein IJP07_06955 [Firmicutes bacterium]|nr:hypothetical protein [Bacillota bacterium]
MKKNLLPERQKRGFLKYLLFTGLLLVFLLLPQAAKGLQEWQDPQLRIERLQKQAAEELRLYYQGEGNWLRCYRLLQRLDRLERQQEGGK